MASCFMSANSWSTSILSDDARSLHKHAYASSYRPWRANNLGDGGSDKQPSANITPGIVWIPSGILHEYELGILLVQNPAQNPPTTPTTMLNCSKASRVPRTWTGAISAIYKGESMLSAPTPRPPTPRPTKMCASDCAKHWNREPIMNTTVAQNIACRRETRSAKVPARTVPSTAPNSKAAAEY
jgi:hypothetical protein